MGGICSAPSVLLISFEVMMDFEKAEAFRALTASGITTAEAVRLRYRERTLDTPEGVHRAPAMASEADPPTEAEQLAALKERAESGCAPRKGQIV
jgi:hypothetical protein